MTEEGKTIKYNPEKRISGTDHRPPMTIERFVELYYFGKRDFSEIVFAPGINFSSVKPPLDLTNMKFDGAHLVKSVFDSMLLDNTTFHNAILTEASFIDVCCIELEAEEESDEEDSEYEKAAEDDDSEEEISNKINPFENSKDLDTTRWGRYSKRPTGVPTIDHELIIELQNLRIEAEELLIKYGEKSNLKKQTQQLSRLLEIQSIAHKICFIIGEQFLKTISDNIEAIDQIMEKSDKLYEKFRVKQLSNPNISDSKNSSFVHLLKTQSPLHSQSSRLNIPKITKEHYQEITGLATVISSNFGIVDDEPENICSPK